MVLAQETPVLLLDEPTTFLGLTHQLEVLDLCKHLTSDLPLATRVSLAGLCCGRVVDHDARMSKVTLSTELPIPAPTAAALARKPELMAFVMSPLLRLRRIDVPACIETGTRGKARLWWFGVIPAWTHHLTIEAIEPGEIRTDEHGGPVRTWKHRLTFTPLDDHRCRYTDEIETDDGWRGALTRGFIRVMFRHRHRRWHTLARILR